MTAWADTKISQYSKGMLQRIGLAQAMGANPDLIILDEPTDGVDPGGRRDIRQVLLQLRQKGATIFINSHLLSELESVCDRVAILVGGSVARQGSVDELTVDQAVLSLRAGKPGLVRGGRGVSRRIRWPHRRLPASRPAGNFPIKPGVNSTELSSESARPMPLMSSLRSTLCAGPG